MSEVSTGEVSIGEVDIVVTKFLNIDTGILLTCNPSSASIHMNMMDILLLSRSFYAMQKRKRMITR